MDSQRKFEEKMERLAKIELKQTKTQTVNTPTHYNNSNGSLYKIAQQRGWNAYQFDAIKRIDRALKKGEFEKDIDKTIEVLKMFKSNL